MDLKKAVVAVRPFSFSASILPVMAGNLYAVYKDYEFTPSLFLLSTVGVLLMHIGTNLTNDYYDYKNGVDTGETYGSSGLLVRGEISSKSVFTGIIVSFTLAILIGLRIVIMTDRTVLWFGITGVAGGLFYTAPPFNYKYHGMGVPLVFLLMGPLMVMGGYYVQARHFTFDVFLFSLSFGIFTALIMLANEIRDIEHDISKGIRSIPLFFGKKISKIIYILMGCLAYVVVVAQTIDGSLPVVSLLTLLTLPLFIKNSVKLVSARISKDIITLDKESAAVQMVFSSLLIIALLIGVMLW
ncbi:1,4-dihydroxy-2-naphthoate octaprenyltransferase [Kosmotoga pacifica]|uniref:1,4-dihydroxy-2-naphthoate octaprenyltransferase n=1 Tax=Kosmotoga pacifica TaxID=1330330 RepID=A0A0G2ZFS1_9BACT|nr:1,4-dihydroxy-2-naphthoate octaprenyltransferase [Kosmotoga pacifica]AKI97638.1 hypothetical protein IX53_07210 [Kosmotoga pacifica]